MQPTPVPHRIRRSWANLALAFVLLISLAPAAPAFAAQAAAAPGQASSLPVAPAAVAAPQAASLAISKTILLPAGRNVFAQGETVVFQIVVENTGGPERIAFLPLADSYDTTCLDFRPKADPPENSADDGLGIVQWNNLVIPNGQFLGPGERITATVTFDVTGPTGTGLNTATVSGALDENGAAVLPDPASSQVSFTCAEPQIELDKTATPPAVLPGGMVGYTYQVTNPGNTPLASVSLNDDTCSPVLGPSPAGDLNSNGLLDPGETWLYLCTMPINVDTTNTATVTGQPTDDNGVPLPTPPVSDNDTAFVDVVDPAIQVVKTASETLVYAGATVVYTYTVTNPGDAPLADVAVDDDQCAPVTGPAPGGDANGNGLLDPGEIWIYTCSALLTADTTNVVTASGQPSDPAGNPLLGFLRELDQDDETVRVIDPAIDIEKTPSASMVNPGDSVTYTYVVTNPGNDPLSNVTVSDDTCAPVLGPNPAGDLNANGLLDPGEAWVYTCTMVLTEDTTNTATVTGDDSLGNPVDDTATAYVDVLEVGLLLEKSASEATVYAGAVVTYTYTLRNSGSDPISNPAVADDSCGPVTYVSGDSDNDGRLDPGETWVFTCTTTLFLDTTNIAAATGDDPLGNPAPPDQASADVNVINPRLQIVKTVDRTVIVAPDTVVYTYEVTNPGDDPLSNVTVSDDTCAPVLGPDPAGDLNGNGLLDPGETWVYTCTTTLAGDTTNTATVTGDDSLGNPAPPASDTAFVNAVNPGIEVVKSASAATVQAGGQVQYTYAVTNLGDVPLSNVSVVDDRCQPVVGPFGDDGNGLLDPGETWTYTCTTALFVDTVNTATAAGQPSDPTGAPLPGIPPVNDDDSASVDVVNPAIDIAKTASETLIYAGGLVVYTYAVTNPGDVPLSNVTVTDDSCAPVIGPDPAGDLNGNGLLDPGEIWLYTCTTPLTEDTTNIATAAGQPSDPSGNPLPGIGPVRDQDDETVQVIDPAIYVEKSANPGVLPPPGGPVIYTYAVTNPGNDPLSNVVVTDDTCAPVTGPQPGDDANGNGLLDPGETWLYTCTMVVAGDTVNTTTATGDDSLGNPVSDNDRAFVDVILPGIEVDKFASDTTVYVGALVLYTYLVRNTTAPPAPIASVVVTDDSCAPVIPTEIIPGINVGDLNGDGLLDPGETWQFTCTTALTQDTTNVATATGLDLGSGLPVSDQASADVDVIDPAIAVAKTACTPAARVGDTVVYTYTVTNPGDDPLGNVTVTDDTCPGVTGPDPAGDLNGNGLLDPGETWIYTCTYVIQPGDPDPLVNTVTAEGEDSLGGLVNDTDTAEVDIVDPSVAIVKTADPTTVLAGATVLYSFAVSNTGDAPLSNVAVGDDTCAPVIGPDPTGDVNGNGLLDPGETWIYTCVAVVTVDTVNTATATGQPSDPNGAPLPGLPPVSDDDTASVDVVAPDILVVKTASSAIVYPGATVVYTYTVTNPGDAPLADVTVSDDRCAPVLGPAPGDDANGNGLLDPGETWTYTCATTLVRDTVNTATASGQPSDPAGNPLPGIPPVISQAGESVDVIDPAIDVEKVASATQVNPGDSVTYTYIVTNPGDDPLSNVTVSDDRCAPVTPVPPVGNNVGDLNNNGLLDPGETWIYTCPTPLSDDTVNTATATGDDSLGNPVVDIDRAFVDVLVTDLQLEKSASAAMVYSGTTVIYTYTVQNSGSDPVSNVLVTDDSCAPVTPVPPVGNNVGDLNNNGLLDPGETWVFRCSAALTEDTTNIATVNATDPLGNPTPPDQASADVAVIHPAIQVVKTANPTVVLGPPAIAVVGYTYLVSNPGDDPLSNITVVDDMCAPIGLLNPSGDNNNNGLLDPGETWTYLCSAPVGVDTLNTVTVSGVDSLGGSVSDQDTAFVDVVNPAVTIVKTANPTVILAGELVQYTYEVQNTGDVPLSNVSVSDDTCAPVIGPFGDDGNGLLDPGETWTYTCTAAIFVDTINTATVTGQPSGPNGAPLPGIPPVSDADTASVNVIGPAIDVEKVASVSAAAPGDTVVYTYTVSNPGDVPLSNVTVNDDTCAPVNGPTPGSDANGNGLLDPGETWTYTCSYVVQPTDPSPLVNIVTAQGDDPFGNTVQDSDQASVSLNSGFIGDLIWLDSDGNTVQNGSEPGIFGVGITLTWFGPDGLPGGGDDVVYTTTTDLTGAYGFSNLPPGNYQVDIDQTSPTLAGLTLTTPASEPVTLTLLTGQTRTDIDFGYQGSTAVQVVAFAAAARPLEVRVNWQVLLNGEIAPAFHLLRARLGQAGVQQVTSSPVGPQSDNGQMAAYTYTDRTVEGGRAYLYFLRNADGQIFGPWQVRVPPGRLFMPLVNSR